MSKNLIFFGLVVILSLKDSRATDNDGVYPDVIIIPNTNLQIPNPHQEIQSLFASLDGIMQAQASTWYLYFLSQDEDLWVSSSIASGIYLGAAGGVQFFERDANARSQIMNLLNNYINHFEVLNVPKPYIPAYLSLVTLYYFVATKEQEIGNLKIRYQRTKRNRDPNSANAGRDVNLDI